MLSPVRSGSGLFWNVGSTPITPKSAPIFQRQLSNFPQLAQNLVGASWPGATGIKAPSTALSTCSTISYSGSPCSAEAEDFLASGNVLDDLPPETDIQPHINIGVKYQAVCPSLVNKRKSLVNGTTKSQEPRSTIETKETPEDMLFDPKVCKHLSDEELNHYLDLACSAVVKGGSCNKEYALHSLRLCNGDIEDAVLSLMVDTPKLPKGHPLLSYVYPENNVWSSEDVRRYHQALMKFDKDFFKIAKDVGKSKNVKQCVEFYYLWKKVCPDEYKRLRIIRKKREQDNLLYNLRSRAAQEQRTNSVSPTASSSTSGPSLVSCLDSAPEALPELEGQSKETNDFLMQHICDFSGCKASFLTHQALRGHMRVHGGPVNSLPPLPVSLTNKELESQALNSSLQSSGDPSSLTQFPCKVCGKVFAKIRSRSAHMKTHKQQEGERRQCDGDRVTTVSAAAFAATNDVNCFTISTAKENREDIHEEDISVKTTFTGDQTWPSLLSAPNMLGNEDFISKGSALVGKSVVSALSLTNGLSM